MRITMSLGKALTLWLAPAGIGRSQDAEQQLRGSITHVMWAQTHAIAPPVGPGYGIDSV